MQVRRCQRLQGRFEAHTGNRTAFVVLGERKIFGMRRRGAGKKEPTEQTPHRKGPICHMPAGKQAGNLSTRSHTVCAAGEKDGSPGASATIRTGVLSDQE